MKTDFTVGTFSGEATAYLLIFSFFLPLQWGCGRGKGERGNPCRKKFAPLGANSFPQE